MGTIYSYLFDQKEKEPNNSSIPIKQVNSVNLAVPEVSKSKVTRYYVLKPDDYEKYDGETER